MKIVSLRQKSLKNTYCGVLLITTFSFHLIFLAPCLNDNPNKLFSSCFVNRWSFLGKLESWRGLPREIRRSRSWPSSLNAKALVKMPLIIELLSPNPGPGKASSSGVYSVKISNWNFPTLMLFVSSNWRIHRVYMCSYEFWMYM